MGLKQSKKPANQDWALGEEEELMCSEGRARISLALVDQILTSSSLMGLEAAGAAAGVDAAGVCV